MIMTAVLHDVWSRGRPLTYYYYISVGGLGTAMEWLNDLKYFLFISYYYYYYGFDIALNGVYTIHQRSKAETIYGALQD